MLLTSRIKELIQRSFSKKNREQRYQYLVIGREKSYFVQKVKKGDGNSVPTTCAISAYHHLRCEFGSQSCEVYSIQHYVIKFVSDLR